MPSMRAVIGSPLSFTDVNGIDWTVTEYGPSANGARAEGAYLVFESDATVRRVRAFPDNWRSLSRDELTRLSWMR